MNAESKDRTCTISNDLNPEWNHIAIFQAHRDDEIIDFDVFDEDIDADDELGSCSVNLSNTGNDWTGWTDLLNVDHGRLKLRIQKLHFTTPDLDNDTIVESSTTVSSSRIIYIQIYVGSLIGKIIG